MTPQTERPMALADVFAIEFMGYGASSERCKSARAALLAALQEQAREGEAVAWRTEAVKWIRRKAEEQRATNEQYPRHAEAYPSWVENVRQLHRLADDLECEQESAPFGIDTPVVAAPQPAQPVGINGLTYDETSATMSVRGLSKPTQPEQGERAEVFAAHSVDGKQHDTGRVTVNGHYFATTASPADARRIAAALQSAQPVAQPLPLTGDVMWELWNSQGDDEMDQVAAIKFARAVEAAHGIGGAL